MLEVQYMFEVVKDLTTKALRNCQLPESLSSHRLK